MWRTPFTSRAEKGKILPATTGRRNAAIEASEYATCVPVASIGQARETAAWPFFCFYRRNLTTCHPDTTPLSQ